MPVQRTLIGNKLNSFKLTGVILALALVSVACMSSTLTPSATQAPLTSTVPSIPASTTGQPGNPTANWLQVFFTNPNPPDNVGNGIDQGVVDSGERVLPDQVFGRDFRAEVTGLGPHVAVGQLEPGPGECVGELIRMPVKTP